MEINFIKSSFLIFFVLVGLIIGSVDLQALSSTCGTTEQEYLKKLDKIVEELNAQKHKKYLWEWHRAHPYCWWNYSACNNLIAAETNFTKRDYRKTLKHLEQSTSQTAQDIKIKLRTHPQPYTQEFCRDISIILIGLNNEIETTLVNPLTHIEELYHKVFPKQ